jgi:hypothetical protein
MSASWSSASVRADTVSAAEGSRGGDGQDDPVGHVEGALVSHGDQAEHDHAHGLVGVLQPVAQGHPVADTIRAMRKLRATRP